MTEQEWFACEVPGQMVGFLRKLGTDPRLVSPLAGQVMLRKLQLFVSACCRLQWDTLVDERSRKAVEVAERFADGQAKKPELQEARVGAEEVSRGSYWGGIAVYLASQATKMFGEQVWSGARNAASSAPLSLLRCVFGNPFRTEVLAPEWLTPTVESVARATYDERDLPSGEIDVQRLAVLSDALEEAGCTDAAILDHLRSSGPHVRGCWALDVILGKA